jgi:hypothetical protein
MAIEEGVARGLDGVRGLVADRKAYGQRTLGWGLEQRLGLLTWGPRTSAGRHAWAVGGQQQDPHAHQAKQTVGKHLWHYVVAAPNIVPQRGASP